ncbi:hypothetical protein CK203_037972 [Vitis vinifera]|uniref:Uncharacterized protein n=1 Tax=Vitis vinifera TaxID=29760 RepID=A0A438HNP0_VITVI|nr:hypothetical protein CK203_037972 [Vitis vinifera]
MRVVRAFTIGNPLGCQGSACGGDDHLAWKRPISSEVYRGLRTVGGVDLPSWVRVEGILVRTPVRSDMDRQCITIDQFIAAMASI